MTHTLGLNDRCLKECMILHALSGLCVGLVLTNSAGKVVWLNHTAERVLGLPINECLGRPLEQLIKDLQLTIFWQESATSQGNTMGEVAVQWPEKIVLKVNATRYVDNDGSELGRAMLFCDVTAERSAQVELSLDVAERLLSLTGDHLPPKPVAHLTPQEVRILKLVAHGLGNSEISEKVHISLSTVRSHMKNIYRKLGLNSRAEVVSFAARNQLA